MAEPEKKPTPEAAPAAAAAKKPEPGKELAKEPAKEPGKEGGEEAAAEKSPAAPAAAGSPLWLLATVIASLVAMPLAGWGIARHVLYERIKAVRMDSVSGPPHGEGGETASKGEGEKGGKEGGHGGKGGAEGDEKPFTIADLIVNVASSGNSRFLRTGIEFNAPKDVQAELKSREGQIKDIICTILRSKRMDELDAVDSTQRLKTEILNVINGVLKKGQVSEIYFTELVIQ